MSDAGSSRVAARSTAWWGTALTVGVLASMLSTIVFAALYLRTGAAADAFLPAGDAPGIRGPLLVLAVAIVSVVPVAWAHGAVRVRSGGRLQAGSALGSLLGGGVLLAAALDLATQPFRWDDHAFGSVYWLGVGFHGLTTLAGVGMLGYAQVHAWRGALEERGRGVAASTALLWYYVVAGWAVLYLALLGVSR